MGQEFRYGATGTETGTATKFLPKETQWTCRSARGSTVSNSCTTACPTVTASLDPACSSLKFGSGQWWAPQPRSILEVQVSLILLFYSIPKQCIPPPRLPVQISSEVWTVWNRSRVKLFGKWNFHPKENSNILTYCFNLVSGLNVEISKLSLFPSILHLKS